jgi:chorismate-pyruvate lyase
LYVKASAALLELGVSWTDRIEKAQDNEKVQILNAYNVARDQLCARVGLAGIAEYNWITEVALKADDNKLTFESAGMKIQ